MKLAIIGDYNQDNKTHTGTNAALAHSLAQLGADMTVEWVPTRTIIGHFLHIINGYQGFLIAPGSPYASMEGVLKVIRFGRENNIPVLGTCGGFQHMVIEFARNVLEIEEAAHAETDPYASKLVITPLSCSLVGQTLEILLTDTSSKAYELIRHPVLTENYYCNFGLNPDYQGQIHRKGFRVVGSDVKGEARILELQDHDFFIGTLFVPQMRSTSGEPHPVVTGFLQAVLRSAESK